MWLVDGMGHRTKRTGGINYTALFDQIPHTCNIMCPFECRFFFRPYMENAPNFDYRAEEGLGIYHKYEGIYDIRKGERIFCIKMLTPNNYSSQD